MLVLTRRIGEGILIGDAIRVSVVEMRTGQVKIGIEAPRDLRVRRDELEPKEVREQIQEAATEGHAREEFKG